jgi:hypothetical protein
MLVLSALTSLAFKFKVLIAQSKRFWGMTGEEQFLIPLFVPSHGRKWYEFPNERTRGI